MRCKPTPSRRTLALALSAFVLVAALPASVQLVLADEAGDDEGQPRGRQPPEEPAAEREIAPKHLGASRRPDPFDHVDEPRGAMRSRAPGAAPFDDGIVRCEAGCDGPRGTVVYKK